MANAIGCGFAPSYWGVLCAAGSSYDMSRAFGGTTNQAWSAAGAGAGTALLFMAIGEGFTSRNCPSCYVDGKLTTGAFAAKVFVHAMAGGVVAEATGGRFGHGFASAGFAQLAAPLIGQIEGDGVGARLGRIVAAATIGGTASHLAGGSFANGAITAAFARAFNDEMHRFSDGRVQIIHGDGESEIRSGGTISWKNNNPGNMRAAVGDVEAIGMNGGFAVFASEADGFRSMMNNLMTERYQSLTVGEAIKTWAPFLDGNDPIRYAATVSTWTGISVDTPMRGLTGGQVHSVANAIQRFEGWKSGHITRTPDYSRLLRSGRSPNVWGLK